MKFRSAFLSFTILMMVSQPGFAANRTWTQGAGTSDWFTAGNWSGAAVPTTADNALVNVTTGPVISAAGAVVSQVRLGTSAGNTGSLTVSGGGSLSSSGNGLLGQIANSTGLATVTGAGSLWDLGANSLNVGNAAGTTGTLLVSAGGQITASSSQIAASAGSTGVATVTGATSRWTNTAGLYVGSVGNGTLNITNGGEVSASFIRAGSNASGAAGDINISSGGVLTATGANSLLGQFSGTTTPSTPGGEASVTVTGTGSQWDATGRQISVGAGINSSVSLTVSDNATVISNALPIGAGDGSVASLTINSGGSVTTANSATIVMAGGAGSNATILVDGAQSQWLISGALHFTNGSGTVTVSNGGMIDAGGTLTIGRNTGSDSLLTVSGGGRLYNGVGSPGTELEFAL